MNSPDDNNTNGTQSVPINPLVTALKSLVATAVRGEPNAEKVVA